MFITSQKCSWEEKMGKGEHKAEDYEELMII